MATVGVKGLSDLRIAFKLEICRATQIFPSAFSSLFCYSWHEWIEWWMNG